MNFLRLSYDRVTYEVDRDVSTTILLVSSGDEVDCLRVAICSVLRNRKPKIWKRYVDDTFTVLDRDRVNGFYNI